MQLLMENPAVRSCGAPVSDLAGASINSEFIASLFPIQANPAAERRFAFERVFRHAPRVEHRLPKSDLDSNLVVTVNGKRFAHRATGIKVKKGPVSSRLGGEYIYRSALKCTGNDWNAEILRRIKAQGLTAGFFGDPPPGRSALDKKKKASFFDGLISPQAQRAPRSSGSRIRAWRAPA